MVAPLILRRALAALLVAGSLTTVAGTGTSSAATSLTALADDFNDGVVNTTSWLSGSGVLEQAGHLVIQPNTSSSASYSQLKSRSTYSVTGSSSSVEVVRVPAGGSSEVWFDLQQPSDASTRESVLYSGGVLQFRESIAGRADVTNIQYSASQHRWWRIRESGGTTFWETSPDGMSWVVQKTRPTASFMKNVSVVIRAGQYSTAPTPGDAILDNFNTGPGATSTTTVPQTTTIPATTTSQPVPTTVGSTTSTVPTTTTIPATTTTVLATTTTTVPSTTTTTIVRPSGPLTRSGANPIVRNGPEAYDNLKAGPRVVLRDSPTSYRMWYEAVSGITQIAYATSTDGVTWTKAGVVGSLAPSLSWEKEETSPGTILYEGGVYKMWYHAGGYVRSGTRLGNGRLGYATSTDGVNWTKSSSPVVDLGAPGSFDDNQVAEPRVIMLAAGSYRMYYTGRSSSSQQTALGMAISTDGVTWTKYSGNPVVNAADWGNAWGGAIFFDKGTWQMWHAKEPSGLFYKWSTDGIVWNDGPSNPVLTNNPDPTSADGQFVGDSVSGYDDGTRYRIMYTGFNMNLFGSQGRFEGICMAFSSVIR